MKVTFPAKSNKEVILKIRGLRKTFNPGKNSEVHAIDNISLDIYKGETLSLVGESGSGKSTTGRVLIKLDSITSGTVLYKGEDINKISNKTDLLAFRKSMQMIFQDPFASLNPRISIKNIIGDALRVHKVCQSDDEVNKKVNEILDIVGINRSYVNRYPTEFSGGQCQRIGIARALCVQPDFIIADECLSALDVSIQAQIVNLLIKLRKEREMTYLFIAHDLSMVKYISDRIAVMKDGKILELAKTEDLYSFPLHQYTISLLSASQLTDLYKEKKIKRLDYDPTKHKYSKDQVVGMFEISKDHWVYCAEEEVENYKQSLSERKACIDKL